MKKKERRDTDKGSVSTKEMARTNVREDKFSYTCLTKAYKNRNGELVQSPYIILTGRVTKASALSDKKEEGLNTCAIDMVLKGTSAHKLWNYAAGANTVVPEEDSHFVTVMAKDRKIGERINKIASSLASIHEGEGTLKKGDIITVCGAVQLSQNEYNGNITEKLTIWADSVDYQYSLTEEELKASQEAAKKKYENSKNNANSNANSQASAPAAAPMEAPAEEAAPAPAEESVGEVSSDFSEDDLPW